MSSTIIRQAKKSGFILIQMENESIAVSFLPGLGGKMVELKSKKTNTQFLQQPFNPNTDYHKSDYGTAFETSDASGFDECFPSVEPAIYNQSFAGEAQEIQIPDHGEVWSAAWNYEIRSDKLILSVNGKQLDYTFQKTISLSENVVHLEYKLINLSDSSFHYLWSSHPLLNIHPGDKILLPDEVSEVFLNWASNTEYGTYGDFLSWPTLNQNNKHHTEIIDFSIVQNRTFGKAFKLFTDKLISNQAGIYLKENDETLLFHFDPKKIPFLGIWLCYGGWPDNSDRKHFTVGLEPTSGRPDSLAKAVSSETCKIIEGNETHQWYLDISLWEGELNV